MEKESTEKKEVKDVKTSKHASRYLIVGVLITGFNYVLYEILFNLILGSNKDLVWLSNFIATAITTIVAYFAHSRVTWKERIVTKHSIIRFFIWNAIITIAITPGFTQLFSLFTPLHEFIYNVTNSMHLQLPYEIVITTDAFVLNSIVIMILNFFLYNKFVFGKKKATNEK